MDALLFQLLEKLLSVSSIDPRPHEFVLLRRCAKEFTTRPLDVLLRCQTLPCRFELEVGLIGNVNRQTSNDDLSLPLLLGLTKLDRRPCIRISAGRKGNLPTFVSLSI